jgi:hypothetical protein
MAGFLFKIKCSYEVFSTIKIVHKYCEYYVYTYAEVYAEVWLKDHLLDKYLGLD